MGDGWHHYYLNHYIFSNNSRTTRWCRTKITFREPELSPVPPEQSVILPVQHVVPSEQLEAVPSLNWSHFKTDIVGKPDEDIEAHLLRKMIG